MSRNFFWSLCSILLLLGSSTARSQGSEVILFDGSNLEEWESVGDGIWSITSEGYLLGLHDPRRPPAPEPWFNSLKGKFNRSWFKTDFKVMMSQAWLYTKREFANYDLHLEWWVPSPGNSGVSVGDKTRGRHTFGAESDLNRTPSQVAYEIQIASEYPDAYPAGSIYMVEKAALGAQKVGDWNAFDLEVRDASIRVTMNGVVVAEHASVAGRATAGPIGLQLHDGQSLAMFRNIRVRVPEAAPAKGNSSPSSVQ